MEPIFYILGGVLILVAVVFLSNPLRHILKLVVNSGVAAALLLGFNWLGAFFGMSVGVNIFTAVMVGILGLPGFATLLIMQLIYK